MEKRWIDANRAAEIVGLKKNTLYVLAMQGRFCPVYKIGRLVRFAEDEVLAWMEKQKVYKVGQHE